MPTIIPAIKGRQFDTDFYVATMEYGEIDQRVVLPHEFLGDDLFDDEKTMQRKLMWARVRGAMKDYLLKGGNAFFSALTLFMIPRTLEPLVERTAADRDGGFEFQTNDSLGKKGDLILYGSVSLFPGDGQHRGATIKEVLREDPSLASQEIPVVLIPFLNRAQVKQLFTDLNLNAKAVNRTIGLSFDTRDPLAIVSRRVGNIVPLFKDHVNRQSNSLPDSSAHVITLNTLCAANEVLLGSLLGDRKQMAKSLDALSNREEDDDEVTKVAEKLAEVWEVIVDSCEPWADVMDGKETPGDIRKTFVFPHGLGFQALARAAADIIIARPADWKTVLAATIKGIDWNRMVDNGNGTGPNPIWAGKAMTEERINNTGPGVTATANYILDQAGIGTGGGTQVAAADGDRITKVDS